jgi:hypothetical protein
MGIFSSYHACTQAFVVTRATALAGVHQMKAEERRGGGGEYASSEAS